MKIIEAGHAYAVESYDGGASQYITFMKRVGEGYPGNEFEPHPGTNCQEVLRVLIDRVLYLDKQISCSENQVVLYCLRLALTAFESRAAIRHKIDKSKVALPETENPEEVEACSICGHWVGMSCKGHATAKEVEYGVGVI